MKKGLRMKRVHGKKSNIGKRNRSRVFSMVIFIMVLSSFFSNVDSLQVQAAGKDEDAFICAEPGNSYATEGVILEEAGGEDSILEEKEGMESGKAAEERIDAILDGCTLPSREKEYDGECEELFAPDVELQDGLNMEVLEQEGLSGASVNYTPTDTYPWGKAMSSSQVTLVAPDGAASHYQWQVADRETGEFTDIAGAETREYTFLPISGKWYRAAMDGYVSKAVQAFQALGYDQEISGTGAGNLDGTKLLKVYDNNQWYITNGVIAYTCVSNGTTYMNLDVLGKYRKDGRTYWMNTAYSNGWQLFTSSSANPSPVSVSGFGDADLKELRFSFEEANKAELHIEAAVGDGVHAFCFGSDVMPGTSEITRGSFNPDCAALTLAKQENGMGVVQMVGAVKPFHVDDPAVVLNYTGGDPDKVWLGYYHSRMAWTNNTVEGSDDTFQTDGEKVIQCLGIDSGMVSSWLGLTGGEVVKFSFNVGNVVEDDVIDVAVVGVSANPLEGGSVSGGGSYNKNASVTVKATPKEGYEFVKWTENGKEASSEASYSFTAASDRNLVAEFKEIQPEPKVYQVQVSAEPSEGGSVSGGGGYEENSPVTVKAAATEGYEFVKWTENGEEASSEASYSFTAASDRNLVAEFKEIQPEPKVYQVQVSAEPLEGGSVSGGGSYTENTFVTVKATAKEGYEFLGWRENGEEAGSETSYSFAVTSDRDLVACFSPINPAETEYTITFDANGGRINKWSAKTVNQKLAELPTASRRGYKFDGWHTKAKGGARVTTKTKFDSDATIFAQWAKEGKSKNINYNGNANGNTNGNTNDGNALDDVPKTGDAQNVCPWFLTAFLSGLGAWYFRKNSIQ